MKKKNINNLSGLHRNRLDQLIILEEQLVASLLNFPDGSLRVSSNRGRTTFYRDWKDSESGASKSSYLKNSEAELVSLLAQKGYEKKLLKLVQKQIAILESVPAKLLDDDCLDQVYEGLSETRKALVTPFRLPDAEYLTRWKSEEFSSSLFHTENLRFTTNNKERVRSKSEMIIADRLSEFFIPYRYEEKIVLKDGTVCFPDFTILDLRTRSRIYWEHFGMVDQKSYSNGMVEKIEKYLNNDILLGENLIVTFESNDHPLDKTTVDTTIMKYLLST